MKTSLSSAWLQRDHGFSSWAVDASRCKRLQENVVAISMAEALWIVMIYYILKSRWKPKKMLSASCDALRSEHLLLLKAASLADASPAATPLALRVEPKPKSGIRQQDLLKKVVEVKPKRQKVIGLPDQNYSDSASTPTNDSHVGNYQKGNVRESKDASDTTTKKSETQDVAMADNPAKSLLGLAYESSDSDED